MPRKIIRKYLPDPQKITENRYLRFLGSVLHDPNLWHLNRSSVARAFFIGLFCCFLPIPFQMFISAFIAMRVHANLPISVALVWITNPLTIPPMFYFTYRIGCFVLGQSPNELNIEFSWTLFSSIWQPLVLGSLVCGLMVGSSGYIAIRLLWRWHVIKSWKQRQGRQEKP